MGKSTLKVLFTTVLFLVAMGLTVLTSASAGTKDVPWWHYPVYQVGWLAMAFAVGWFAYSFDYHWWIAKRELTIAFAAGVMLLLAVVVTPGIRASTNGSYRWLRFGPIGIQPSEFAKIMLVVGLSAYLAGIRGRVKKFLPGAMLPAAFIVAIVGLLVLEPDYGSLAVIAATGFTMMILAGSKVLYFAPFGLLAVVGIGVLLMFNENRMKRLMAFFNPDKQPYQLEHSLYAFHNGGLWGQGWGQGMERQFYLPECHTDFIMAVGAEDGGFVFSMLVVAGFFILLVCGTILARKAPDKQGALLAFGMTFLLVLQGFGNIAVVTGLVPTKGMALPFFSYGGTNMMASLFAVGTLLNIGRQIEWNVRDTVPMLAKNAVRTI